MMRPVDKTRRDIIDAKNPVFDRDDMEKFHRKGFNYKQVSEIMGCSELTVRFVLDGRGYTNMKERTTNHDNWSDEAFVLLHGQKKNDTEISEILGCKRSMVQKFRERLGLEPNLTRRRGKKTVEPEPEPKKERWAHILNGEIEVTKISYDIPREPLTRSEWNDKRIKDLAEWISYKVLRNERVDSELMREYQALTDIKADNKGELANEHQRVDAKI